MIFNLTIDDMRRILLIHHIILIGLVLMVSILWAKLKIQREEINRLKREFKKE